MADPLSTRAPLLLNCDLGESYGNWRMGLDEDVMPYLDQANVACGFHAGDPLTIERTLALAARYGVAIGAHPAYPDLVGFGRRSMALSAPELRATLLYQIAALDGMARVAGATLAYVKPHGALYNDMMRDPEIRGTIMDAVSDYPLDLPLMLQAGAHSGAHLKEAAERGLTLLLEAFADRRYDAGGLLLSRREPGAVLDHAGTLAQVRQLLETGCVRTVSGAPFALQADSLCVHGDNAEGVRALHEIRQLLDLAA